MAASQVHPRMRWVVLLLLLAAVFALGPARQVDAIAKRSLFRATYTTTGVAAPCGTLTVCVEVSGAGQGTHLGRWSTIAKSVVVHIGSTPCTYGVLSSYTADMTLTAANGDTITLSGSGISCAGPGGIQASGLYSVTGGTGAFHNAAGTIAESIVRVGLHPRNDGTDRNARRAPGPVIPTAQYMIGGGRWSTSSGPCVCPHILCGAYAYLVREHAGGSHRPTTGSERDLFAMIQVSSHVRHGGAHNVRCLSLATHHST